MDGDDDLDQILEAANLDIRYQPPPVTQHVAPVVPPPAVSGAAAVLSFFLPGLGQIYNGRFIRALIIMAVFWISLVALVTAPFAVIIWVWSIVDAYYRTRST